MTTRLTDPYYLTAKVTVASAVSVWLCQILQINDALSAGFVALICVVPSVYAGLRAGLEQFAGSVLGGCISTCLLIGFGLYPLDEKSAAIVLLAMGLSLAVCFRLGWGRGYVVTGFTVLYVITLPFRTASEALGTRFLSVMVGVLCATLVNVLVSALTFRKIYLRRMELVRQTFSECLREFAKECRSRVVRRAQCMESVFPVTAVLYDELLDARREFGLFPKGRTMEEVESYIRQTKALEQAAHFAKTYALLQMERTGEHPEVAGALEKAAAVVARPDGCLAEAAAILRKAIDGCPDTDLQALGVRMCDSLHEARVV